DRLSKINTQFEGVRAIERADLANALWTEPRAGPVRGATVERRAEHGHVVLPAPTHVLEVGRLEERVDAGEVRQLAPGEGGDSLVDDRVRAGQAELEAAGDLLLPPGGGEFGLTFDGVTGLRAVVVVQVVVRGMVEA